MNTSEYEFSVNDFGEPVVLKNSEAIATLLARLLLLDPGTIQSHPDMGVGLVSKYRYSMDNHISDLQSEFRRQINRFLPQFQGVEVQAYLKNHICYINATIDGIIYAFFYDVDANNLRTTYSELSDL